MFAITRSRIAAATAVTIALFAGIAVTGASASPTPSSPVLASQTHA